jgi:hypothetical protein
MLLSDFKRRGNFKGRKKGSKNKKRNLIAAGLIGAGLLGATALALKFGKKPSVPKGSVDVGKYAEVLENVEKKVAQQATPNLLKELKEVAVGLGDPVPVISVKRGLYQLDPTEQKDILRRVSASKDTGNEVAKGLEQITNQRIELENELNEYGIFSPKRIELDAKLKKKKSLEKDLRQRREEQRYIRREQASKIQSLVGVKNAGKTRKGRGTRGKVRKEGYEPNFLLGNTQYAEKVVGLNNKTVGVRAGKRAEGELPFQTGYTFNSFLGNVTNW